MKKRFNFRKNLKNLLASKFNIFIIIISIIGIIVGSKFLGLLPSLILFIIFDIVMFLLQAFLCTGTKYQRKKKRKIFLITLLLLFIIGLIAIGTFIIIIIKDAPEFTEDALYTKEASVLYDINGNVFARLGSEHRIKISYKDLPQVLIDAIIATEDSRFYEHKGVDMARFLKASFFQLLGNAAHIIILFSHTAS